MSVDVPTYSSFDDHKIPFCRQSAKEAGWFSGISSRDRSVRRHRRIDVVAPGCDASPHALGLFKPLLSQPVGDPKATDAMMAMNDDPPQPPSFDLVEPLWQFLHWDQTSASNFGGGVFLWSPAVEQETARRFSQ
jgi:hypothetical protein